LALKRVPSFPLSLEMKTMSRCGEAMPISWRWVPCKSVGPFLFGDDAERSDPLRRTRPD
jgi:hypothetical protein